MSAKIIHINSQRRRLGLSVRQAAEPQGAYESFGEVDENSPFASADLSSYDVGSLSYESPEPTTETPPTYTSFPEDEVVDGEAHPSPAEIEPETITSEVNGSTAAPAEEVPSTSPEAHVHEEDSHEVASTASQSQPSE